MSQNWNPPDNSGQSNHPFVQQHVQQHVPPQWQGQPGYPPPRRRRGLVIAGYALGGLALLAISAGAAFALRHHTAAAAKPLTCKQQYAAWKTGPAHPLALKMKTDGNALDAAGSSEDIKLILNSLKTIGADATALKAYPIPACADPKGYWLQVLADMTAAGDNADGASGLGGLLVAEAPLKNATKLSAKLGAELAKTAGVKPS